jgi:hypothetical protein
MARAGKMSGRRHGRGKNLGEAPPSALMRSAQPLAADGASFIPERRPLMPSPLLHRDSRADPVGAGPCGASAAAALGLGAGRWDDAAGAWIDAPPPPAAATLAG